MNPIHEHIQTLTRRHFFGRAALGLGHSGAGDLIGSTRQCGDGHGWSARPAALRAEGQARHLSVHERRPSQMDLFDYKPTMDKLFDKDLPDSIPQGPTSDDDDQRADALPHRAVEVQVRSAWQVRCLGQRTDAVDRENGGQTRHSSRASIPRRSTTIRPSPTSAPAINCLDCASLGAWLSYGLGTEQPESAGLRRYDGFVDGP